MSSFLKRVKVNEKSKFAVILGGGDANRLLPISLERAKAATPILANHRLIDIPLSNLINSNIKRIYVTVQNEPHSLMTHLNAFADTGISSMHGEFIETVPPMKHLGFFESDADSLLSIDKSVWRHINLEETYDYAVIMMSDQVIKIDLREILYNLPEMIDMVMVYTEVPKAEAANKLGVLTFHEAEIINNGDEILYKKVKALHEKLADPPESRPGFCSANLQLLVLKVSALKKMLENINEDPSSVLSKNALQKMINNPDLNVCGYDLNSCLIGGERFPGFFDIESPDTLHLFSMQMCDTVPPFNAHHEAWPLLTTPRPAMAGKIGRAKRIENIMTGYNLIIEDECTLIHSVISRNSIIRKGSTIINSVINDNCIIGPGCHIENAIIDKGNKVPGGTFVAPNAQIKDLMKYEEFREAVKNNRQKKGVPVITPNNIVVIPKGIY